MFIFLYVILLYTLLCTKCDCADQVYANQISIYHVVRHDVVTAEIHSLPWCHCGNISPCCHRGNTVTLLSPCWQRHHIVTMWVPTPCCHRGNTATLLSPCWYRPHGVTMWVPTPCCHRVGTVTVVALNHIVINIVLLPIEYCWAACVLCHIKSIETQH